MRHENEKVNMLALTVSYYTVSVSLLVYDMSTSVPLLPLFPFIFTSILSFSNGLPIPTTVAVTGSLCKELWPEVSSGTREIQIPQ